MIASLASPLIAPLVLAALATVLAAALRPRMAALLGAGAAAAGFAFYLSLLPGLAEAGRVTQPFMAVPSLGMGGGLAVDGLSLVFALLITGIGSLIFLYSSAYLKDDPRLRRLAIMLLAFMLAMLGSVTADDVIVLFVFWEVTSLTSFFLVGFNHENKAARHAALQALLVTGGGGLALLAGLVLVSIAAGTTSIAGILAAREAVLAHPAALPAMLLVIAGGFTKSAQVPFHFWLPNAMAAPTPVSAYLHSATMVKLGVYLLARFNPLYQDEAAWQAILTWGGLATTATGAFLALRETDLKRVLAYTTVTGLGTLTMLIGIAPALSATAAVTFLIVHAFYKAALFLVAGIVDHETGVRDASRLGGLGRAMPLTAIAAVLAALSMAGLPPFVGFVAKELIYEVKIEGGQLAFVLVAVGFLVNAAMVAIAGVLSLRLFLGRPVPTPRAPHDPGPAMLAGPILLAALGLAAGALPGFVGSRFVDPAAAAILGRPAPVALTLWHGFTPVLALSVATVAAGALLFVCWGRLVPRLRRAAVIDLAGPAAAYDRGLAAIIRLAEDTTARVQHGSLRGYLRTLFAVTAAAILATLALRGGFDRPTFDWATVDARALAFLGLPAGALAAAIAPTMFIAVLSMGLVGFATAIIFLVFGAPDVAFTQFAVETLLVVIFAAALVRLPIRRRSRRTTAERATDAAIAIATGGATTLLLLAVLATPHDGRLSAWFATQSVPAAHGRNVVNVILVDFRALDTLGEITVLAIAAFAVTALLRAGRSPEETKAP
ncbi:multisubunit sodium/proton antiporter MrpA subunit [Stella humosa]|uniref:Multisubunit sodium/proton antiporter MrpA subunit n=2 Tax=Stella humosa TaxID=94 RepID=A0A3N1MAT6_9PROT|nr:hydrogen gas-evolving membrane-bound hydrogenase subunit E [Stella humosa]ROQ00379.1 multisubunit sodium/proton antiporter MrpA subunit [Stella humosa]